MDSPAKFKNGRGRLIVNSGDVMYDNSMFFATLAEEKSDILNRLGVKPDEYVLTTIHRPNNTDDPERLTNILSSLLAITEREGITLVLPLHPRTRNLLDKNLDAVVYEKLMNSPLVKIIPPASFFEIIVLEKNARIVMTDSGGVQKESFFFERPCVILRPETEWTEIVEYGAGVIADADPKRIVEGYDNFVGKKVKFPKLFGDSNAAEHILNEIVDYLK